MAQPSPSQLECPVPGCGKLFSRKELLNRHSKSHNPELHYTCHICGRRYARSDVLRRHVNNHPKGAKPMNILPPCTSCQDVGLTCDNNTPCHTCAHNSAECIRPVARNVGTAGVVDANNGAGGDTTLAVPTEAIDDSVYIGYTAHADNAIQASPRPAQDPWASASNDVAYFDLGVASPEQWLQGPARNPYDYLVAMAADVATVSPVNLAINEPQNLTNFLSDGSVMNQGRSTTSRLVTPTSNLVQETANLQNYLNQTSPTTKDRVKVYFDNVHPYWPILHPGTFSIDNTPPLLLGSMLMLSDRIEEESSSEELATLVFKALDAAQLSKLSLHTLQALLLSVVYTIHCLGADGMLQRALRLNGTLVSACRLLDIFNDQHSSPELIEEPALMNWLAQEQLHRLAFAVLRADTYLSILLGHPPTVRYGELSIPLPKTTRLWTAAAQTERRQLQFEEPSGREKTLFSALIHNALDESCYGCPYSLTEDDYHLALCAMQGGAWEAAREAHSCAADNLITKLTPGPPANVSKRCLGNWRTNMNLVAQPHVAYYSPPTGPHANYTPTPLSLILWHICNLKIDAPVDFLRVPGNYLSRRNNGATPVQLQNARSRLLVWISRESSRAAVRNAAQICRIVQRERSVQPSPSTRLLMNPLALPGALMSAIVALTWASQTQRCRACIWRDEPKPIVDLFETDDNDGVLLEWIATGNVITTWGSERIPVCQCHLPNLSSWFRDLLSTHYEAALPLEDFLAELTKV